MMMQKSPWGGCKRSLYQAPRIWELVREEATSIRDGVERRRFLLEVMIYAAFGERICFRPGDTRAASYWALIDEAAQNEHPSSPIRENNPNTENTEKDTSTYE